MTTFARSLVIASCAATLLFLISGCDEPNDPDIPAKPYHLVAQYSTRGNPVDLELKGDLLAIAEQAVGAVILDISNPLSLDTIFVYTVSLRGACDNVALDLIHHYLSVSPADLNFYPVFDYTIADQNAAQIPFGHGFGTPLYEFEMVPQSEDTLWFLGDDETPTDNVLNYVRVCWDDTLGWQACPTGYPAYIPPLGKVKGFDIRDDGLIALAAEQGGVHVVTMYPFEFAGFTETPGLAYDCTWFGNYIVVADQYQVIVVDASNPTAPHVVSELRISNADRLRGVAMDGNYACVLDQSDGIYVVDVSNPLTPKFVQLIDQFDPTSVAAANGTLYVADEGNGLFIYSR